MKVLTGKIISIGMQNTVVVEVSRRTPHPLYKKLIVRSKKYKVDPAGKNLQIGDTVEIVETRPISKDKHFKVGAVVQEKKKEKSA